MQSTAGWRAASLHVMKTPHSNPRALSPAVADLVLVSVSARREISLQKTRRLDVDAA